MASEGYFDKKRREFVVLTKDNKRKTFSELPGAMDYILEAFEPNEVRATLEQLRKQRGQS